MSLLLSSNNIIKGLYNNNLLKGIDFKKSYHILNIDLDSNRSCGSFKNYIQWKKKLSQINILTQFSPLSSNDSGKSSNKNSSKALKSNAVKKQEINSKNSNNNDVFSFKQQQQLNQIRQVQQNRLQQQSQIKYDNLLKSKKITNATINMSTISTPNRTSKSINIGKVSTASPSTAQNKTSSQKIINSNRYMYNQDVDGKTMFQQQIYNNTSFNNPREIREYLDKFVIGQDKLKQTLSVALYNHYIKTNDLTDDRIDIQDEIKARMAANIWHQDGQSFNINSNKKRYNSESVVLDKSNVLLVGPTGTGKTLISKTIAEILDVPFSINDATPFTQAGYVGEDAEVCVARLLQNAEYDIARAQKGIIFIDEIDKIARRSDSVNSGQRDVSGEGVQQGLLRLLEGTNVTITVKNNHNKRGLASLSQQEVYTVNTSNILFICSGAFVGLDKIIIDRLSKRRSIGFDSDNDDTEIDENDVLKNPLNYVEPEDLVKYGLIPEFVGRLPVLANTNQLEVLDLINILIKPKNSIVEQYKEIFKRNGIQLFFQDSALKSIAELAIQKNTGARGLRRILESILNDIMYEYFGSEYRYIVVSNNVKKPIVMTSGLNNSSYDKIKRKTSVANNIINSTKTTSYKYGEEDKLMACLKDSYISRDYIMLKNINCNNKNTNNTNTDTRKENISIESEDVKHAVTSN
ncbi:ClpX, ATPase regulatory subunit [Anaeromyces robustus]|uniref:ClpX, ATPase regulatory subunit n=1 Tax=Anaeromyces robustus TaxID=1754192 RepID=A0A1Y1XEH9_9FUNG|nr:ClpX, ATPase regulatory subunit [Anaeromyces robustus]|eukprot:ORX83784.1 ClpX, ATPase regulatory subunit [Anaeromyces robustus]